MTQLFPYIEHVHYIFSNYKLKLLFLVQFSVYNFLL